jgi:hypothetical protein
VVSSDVDQSVVAELEAKMGSLERSLSILEARVAAQLAFAKDIPDVVHAVKELYSMSLNIPVPERPENSSVVVELRKSIAPTARTFFQQPSPVDAQPLTATPVAEAKATKPAPPPPENPPLGESFVRHVTDEELKSVSKSVFFRVPIAKVNAWIDEINGILSKRQQVIKLPSNGVKPSLKRAWERYESEKLEDDTRLFFTMEDVKDMTTLKNNQKNALTLLQSLGRIYSSTDGQLKRWFVK